MYERTWETVHEMMRDADAAYRSGRQHGDFSDSRFVGREFASWEDVLAKANGEWAEGLAIIRGMQDQIERRVAELPPPADRRRRRKWSDEGDEIDNDRLRSGQEFWSKCERQSVAGPQTVTLFVGVTTSAYRSWQDVLWRGAAAIVLADLLERHGYQVELWGVQNVANAYRNGQGMTQGVCLKRADQPIDASTLVNALSGWFYRTVCFQAYYVEEVTPNSGLGRPVPLSAENQFVKEHTGNGKAVVVDSIWNEAEAVQFVLNAVHDL